MSCLLSSNGTLTIGNHQIPVILHQASKNVVHVDCLDLMFSCIWIELDIDCFSNNDKSFTCLGRLHETACPYGSRCTLLSSTLRGEQKKEKEKEKEEMKQTIDISDNGVVVASISFNFQPVIVVEIN
jgi:hypothetical protein